MNYCCVNLQVTSHCLENVGKWLYKDERVQKRVSLKVTQFSLQHSGKPIFAPPVPDVSPNVSFETVVMFVCLTPTLSGPTEKHC